MIVHPHPGKYIGPDYFKSIRSKYPLMVSEAASFYNIDAECKYTHATTPEVEQRPQMFATQEKGAAAAPLIHTADVAVNNVVGATAASAADVVAEAAAMADSVKTGDSRGSPRSSNDLQRLGRHRGYVQGCRSHTI